MIPGTFVCTLIPKNGGDVFDFLPGQYAYISNPAFESDQKRPFSIASSPLQKKSLEFCIRVYGEWTKEFVALSDGSEVIVDGPHGNFTNDLTSNDVVFLVGGTGISPVMSILRTYNMRKQSPTVTILYGNRTPETIAYRDELETLEKTHSGCKIVHVFSDLTKSDTQNGYTGFVTEDIIKQEVDLSKNPTFFLVGPPIFLEKMTDILQKLHIPKDHIKKENT